MKDLKDVNNAELTAEELNLACEIRKHIDKTDSTQLICNYEIGKLIDEAYGEEKKYGSGQIERVAKQVGKAPSTLYGYLKLAQDYTYSDINTLATEKFSTPYKLLKAYKKLGRDEIMEIHDAVDSLNEFKTRLKARWLESKIQKNAEQPEPTVVDPQTDEGDGDSEKDSNDTVTPDNENSPRGENSAAPETEPSSAPTTNSDEKSLQDQHGEDNPEPKEDPAAPVVPSTPDAETPPALNDDPKPEEDEKDPQEKENPPTSNLADTKQMAGSAVQIAKPDDENSGTPVDMLNANPAEDQTGIDDEIVPIAKSRLAELETLEKENTGLKLKIDFLYLENKKLRKTIETLSEELDAQASENEFEYA